MNEIAIKCRPIISFIIVIFVSYHIQGCSDGKNKEYLKLNKFSGFSLSDSERENMKNYNVIDSSEVLKIDNYEKILYKRILKNIKYVALETTKESLIGEVCKIKIYQDKIYILDNVVSKNVYIFDLKGKFINKIRGFGEGPNEIFEPYDFDIDEGHGYLVILDGRQSKFVYYDLYGKPIKEKRIFFRIQNFRYVDQSTIVAFIGTNDNSHLTEIDRFDLLTLDSSFRIKYKGFLKTEKESKNEFTQLDHLHDSNTGQIIYAPKFKRSIFSVDSSRNVKKIFEINFSDKEVPKEYYDSDIRKLLKYTREFKKYYFEGTYQETSSVIYTKVSTSSVIGQIHLFYDKEAHKYIYGKIGNTSNDTFFVWSLPMASHKNQFISTIQSELLVANRSYILSKNKIDDEFNKIAKNAKEFDNPILQFYEVDIKENLD